MMLHVSRALVIVAPLLLAGCGLVAAVPPVTPGGSPGVPQLEQPAYVTSACGVLRWAVPIGMSLISSLPPNVRDIVSRAQPALDACAAGRATDAIVALATELQRYLMRSGHRPPVGVAILVR
jgi:hypothetical protein